MLLRDPTSDNLVNIIISRLRCIRDISDLFLINQLQIQLRKQMILEGSIQLPLEIEQLQIQIFFVKLSIIL